MIHLLYENYHKKNIIFCTGSDKKLIYGDYGKLDQTLIRTG
jgi:hypothetical protein